MPELTLVEHRFQPAGSPPPSASATLAEASPQAPTGLLAVAPDATKAPMTPYVVLTRVFEIGARATLHERGLPFALLVSQVCRHWRNVAAQAPSVWCAIPVHPLRGGLTGHFISRAGLCTPLSLYLHIVSEWNLDKTLDFLFRAVHVPRIRELRIHVYHRSTSVSVFIWRLGRTIDLPRLAHLEVSWLQEAEGHYLGNLPPLLNTNPSADLTSVVLRGALFSLQSLALRNMRSLTLAAPSQVVAPLSYTDFRGLLSACPVLEHLKLDGLFPVLTHGVRYPAIELPALTALELVMKHDRTPAVALRNDPSYLADFFALLSAPSAHTLAVETHWAPAARALAHALSTATPAPHLALTLGPQEEGEAAAPPCGLFVAFPALRRLALGAPSYAQLTPLLRAWAARREHEQEWARLQRLTLRTRDAATRAEHEELDGVLALLRLRRARRGPAFDVRKTGLPGGGAGLAGPSRAADLSVGAKNIA